MKRSWVLGFLMVLSGIGFSQNSRITSLSTQTVHNDSAYVMIDKVGYTRAKKEMIKDVVAISSRVDDTTTEVVNGKIRSKIFKATGNNISSRNSGNVGIGTTSPDSKLQVIGNIKATNGNLQGDTVKGYFLGLYPESDPVWISDSGDYGKKTWVYSLNYLNKIRFTNDSIVKNDSIAQHRIAINRLLDSLRYIYTEAQVNALLLPKLGVIRFTNDSAKNHDSIAVRYTKTQVNNLLLTKLSVSRFTADSAKNHDSIAVRYTKAQTNNLLGAKIDSNMWWRGTGDHSIKQNSDVLFINNTASGDFSFVVGANNIASGLYSSVTGGESNSASNGWSVINGGKSNSITQGYSGIVGGESNTITQVKSFIGGGASHSITGPYSGILGGNNNDITGSYSGIVGGSDVLVSNNHSFIGSGYMSSITGTHSGIVGGGSVGLHGDYSFIGGGHIITDSSEYSGIIGGSNNILTSAADRSVILGGQNITCAVPDYVYVPNLYAKTNVGIGYTNPSCALAVNGNVGIGTTIPLSKLDVAGNILVTGGASHTQIQIQSDSNTADYIKFKSVQTPNYWQIGRGAYSGTGARRGKLTIGYNGYGTAMTIDTNCSIGIGTTSPTNPLEIVGNTLITNTAASYVCLYLGSSNGGHSSWALRRNYNGGAPPMGFQILYGSTNMASIDTAGNFYIGGTAARTAKLAVNGNVGIGTTAAANALTVVGRISCTNFNLPVAKPASLVIGDMWITNDTLHINTAAGIKNAKLF